MTENDVFSLIETVPLPMLVIGADQRIAAANAPLRGLLGDHLEGRHFITALRQPVLVAAVERVFETDAGGQGLFMGREAGRDLIYDVSIRPHSGAVVLTFTDRTAAKEVNQLRRDFVANVSHELRTPLTAIFGFIDTLRGPARDDANARERFLGIMEREATRMIRLVDDLLSLSRVEEEERVRPSDPVPIGDLVRTAIADLAPVLADANVILTDDSAGAAVPADARQLRQVIGNLIENAVKYGQPDVEIRINIPAPSQSAGVRGPSISLTVCDDGPGIAAHHLPRLTERFYRVDDHRNRDVGGTGLGLAIVKHIVSRHRGRLVITSTVGQGTEMKVILPVTAG